MDETVVVTGADAGLGAAIARAFGEEAATLVLGGRNHDGLAAVREDIEAAGGTVHSQRADARDEYDLERLMEMAARTAGPIDVVIPAQAVAHDAEGSKSLPIVSYSAFDDVIRATLRGAFSTIREATPHLPQDAVILLPLPAGSEPGEGSRPFSIATAGRRGLLEVAAADLEQAVVGVEHEAVAGREVDADSLEYIADGFVAAVADADSLDGSVSDVADLRGD